MQDKDLPSLHSMMAADDLGTQGARSSATMIHVLTKLNWDNSVPAQQGLTH